MRFTHSVKILLNFFTRRPLIKENAFRAKL